MSRPVRTVKWYTRIRRIPTLVGKMPDGSRMPGGPYTLTQFVGVGAVLLLAAQTRGVWAQFGLMTNLLLVVGVAVGVGFGLGMIPVGGTNPLILATGLARLVCTSGQVGGARVTIPRPYTATARATFHPSAPARGRPPAPVAPAREVVAAAVPPTVAATAAAGHQEHAGAPGRVVLNPALQALFGPEETAA